MGRVQQFAQWRLLRFRLRAEVLDFIRRRTQPHQHGSRLLLLTYDKLRARAPLENIFPGHDVRMATDYPKVAEDITRLA